MTTTATITRTRTQRIIFIEVTQEMIDIAQARTMTRCPVAVAIANADPSAKYIRVDRRLIKVSLTDMGQRLVFATPTSVTQFIDALDLGSSAKPFRFALDVRQALSVRPIRSRTARQLASLGTAPATTRRNRGPSRVKREPVG